MVRANEIGSAAAERNKLIDGMAVGAGNELILSRRPTTWMRVALAASIVLFAAAVMTQVFVTLTALALCALVALAAEILLHTGGLDLATFETAMYASIGVILAVAVGVQVHARRRARAPAGAVEPLARRPDAAATAMVRVLLVALALVVALGWHRSVFFPYPLATIVVLANVYVLGVLAPVVFGRAAVRFTRALFAIGARSHYLAGAMTVGLALGSAAALVGGDVAFHAVAARVAREREREHYTLPRPGSVADVGIEALCVAGDEIAPGLAEGSDAPACASLFASETDGER